jgi:ribosomal protein S21
MLKVKIDEKTPLEKALKQLKGKVIKTKQNEKLEKDFSMKNHLLHVELRN